MIQEVRGDILLTKAEVIAHGVAPFDHFDSGLALALRQDYPSMAKDFRHWCHQQNPKPGEAWIWSGSDGKRIVCLLTQEPADGFNHSGHPKGATLSHVGHALKALRKMIEHEHLKSIAIPRLATGVGGLDWRDVQPLIQAHLGDTKANIYLYSEYVKGQKEE